MPQGYDGLPNFYTQSSNPITPNLGLSLKGMDPIVAEDFYLIDTAFGTVSGSIRVNGSVVNNPNFKDSATVTFTVVGSDITLTAAGGGGTPQNTPAVLHQWLNSYNSTTGAFTQTQPALSDISGTGALVSESGGLASSVAYYSSANVITADAGFNYGVFSHKTLTLGDATRGGQLSIVQADGGGGNTAQLIYVSGATGSHGFIFPDIDVGNWQVTIQPPSTDLNFYVTNVMTALGDLIYGRSTSTPAPPQRLAGNITTTKQYLSQTGNGSISAAPAWAQVAYADISGTPQLPVTKAAVSHNFLTSYTSSTGVFTAAQPAVADLSDTPNANTVLAGPTTGSPATATFRALVAADIPALPYGTGTVTSFSAGTLSPLFTTSVATATTTPALSFSLSNAGGGTLFGNNTASAAAPAYTTAPVLGIPGTSTGSIALASSTASGKFTITAPANAATPTLTLPTTSNVLAGQFAGDGTIFSSSLVAASAAGTLILPTPLTQTANFVFAGPTSGAAAAPTFRALVAADIPSGTVIWNTIGNPTGNLTLSMANFTTEFDQTSGVAWLWNNTTTATSGTTNATPLLELAANYWTGAASAQDLWTLGSSLAAGTNGASTLKFTHTGSTGIASVNVPQGTLGTTGAWGLGFGNASVGLCASSAILAVVSNNTSTYPELRLYAGSTDVLRLITATTQVAIVNQNLGAGSGQLALGSSVGAAGAANLVGLVLGDEGSNGGPFACTSGTAVAVSVGKGTTSNVGGVRFNPASGNANFVAFQINPSINQTSTASGSYTALKIAAVETALLGSSNKLIDCFAGSAGTTEVFAVDNSGKVTEYAGTATVSQGMPSEIVTIDLTAQTAAIAATNIIASAPATGMYRISWTADITTAGTTSVLGGTAGFQVGYTSPTDSVAKLTVSGNSITSAANTTGTAVGGSIVVYAKTGTAITYQYDYTSTGTAMAYELHIKLERM